MLNKIYRQYELNKKYAIRKFSVGVFSVAVGLLVSNANQLPVINTYLGNNIVQAAETSVIYSNPNANGEIDEKGTNNNAISKIELISETDKKIRLRISIVDDVDVSKGFVFKKSNSFFEGYTEPLVFNNEKVGTIPENRRSIKEVKDPSEFKSIDEYYNYIQSLDSQSDELNQYLKLNFNNNFKKYNKNRVVEFDLKINDGNVNFIGDLYKKNEPSNEKIKMLEGFSKNISSNIYLNNNKIYSNKEQKELKVNLHTITQTLKEEKEYNEFEKIKSRRYGIEYVENKPLYLSDLFTYYPLELNKINNDDYYGKHIYTNTINKKLVKAGTKFRFILNSDTVEFKNNNTSEVKNELSYLETEPNKIGFKEIFENEQLVKRIDSNTSGYNDYKIPAKYTKINNNTYELEILEDIVVKSNPLGEQSLNLPPKLYETKLKEDFLNHLDINEYKKALQTGNFGEIFGKITTEIKEPDDKEYSEIYSSSINSRVATSYTFGESSTGTIKVKYVDENNNEIAPLETIVENKPWYTKIEIPKKNIQNYEFVSSDQPLNDLVMSGERTITFKYRSLEKTREIGFSTIYESDETKEKGLLETVRKGENGLEGYKETDKNYSRIIKPKTDKIVKVGTKPEINETSLPFKTIYQKDDTKLKGEQTVVTEGKNGKTITTTTYTLDTKTGNVITNQPTNKTENPVNKIVKVGTKPKIEVTSIASPKKYIKDETREKGQPDIVIQGKPGTTTITTTYSVKENDGSITENKGNPVIVNPTDTIIKVAAKDKVEIIKNNDKTIERTTNYTVNEKTGEISETVTDKLISSNTPIDENNNPILPPIVDDLPEYNGGVNPIDSLVNEKPEYKGPLSTNTPVNDKGELVLPPTVNDLPEYNGGANPVDTPIHEIPEYTGTLSTNTPVDDKGELILPPTVNELPEYKGGVNPVDSPIHEIPEYTGPLSTNTPVDDKGELILPPTVNELPEYKGGVNPVDSPIHEIPEYTGPLSTNTPVDDKGELILPPVVDDLPEYNTPTLNNEKSEKTKEESKQERELPNTNSTSILTTLVSSVIGTLGLGYKSKRRK